MAVNAQRCPHCTTIFSDDEVAKRVAHLRGAKRLLYGFIGAFVLVLILVDKFDQKKEAEVVETEQVKPVAAEQTTPEEQQPAPSTTVAFKPEWLPKAQGTGNFEICLSRQAEENDVKDVTLPVGMMFESWGHLTGPLRDDEAHISASAHNVNIKDQYAVALTEAVHLTTVKPCRIANVRAVVNYGFRYSHDSVPASAHYSFGADGLYLNKKGGISNDQQGPAGIAAQIGIIFGVAIADIGDVYAAVDD